MRPNTRGTVLPRIEVHGIMIPLKIEPKQNGQPFYVNLRNAIKNEALRCNARPQWAGQDSPPPLTASKTPISKGSDAKSDAHDAPEAVQAPDLTIVVKAWPTLPVHIKAAIKALVQTHKTEKE